MKRKNQRIRNSVYIGTVDHVSPQYAFIIVEGIPKDIMIPHTYLRGAMHQDTVQIVVTSYLRKPEGRVIQIIKRATNLLVGRIMLDGNRSTFLPDNKKIHYDFQVKGNPTLKWQHKSDDKVILAINTYPKAYDKGVATIKNILGPSGSPKIETQSIIAQFQLNESFDDAIEKEVAAFPDQLSEEEVARRRDFRAIPTVTIDPEDAKDFDDALSLNQLPDGHYEVGIHIADVTHYVKEGTPLDEEASRRSTSVYLVGNTVSMLPERLANNLCSLKPKEDRPAFSVVVTLDKEATIQNVWIGESVIHSNHRFTYDEAHAIIEKQKGLYCEELTIWDQLAKKMRARRVKDGGICFQTTSPSIQLDKEGNPTHIYPKKSNTTHQLIEEYALLANRLVAKTVWNKKKGKKHLPFIYRTHDQPEKQKVADFARLLRQIGYSFDATPAQLPTSYNQVLAASKNTPHEALIEMLAIRTMAQACYTTTPKGHFGLGFQYYTHFTSPIRRYSDVIAHRLLKHYLAGGKHTLSPKDYEAIARHASAQERVATEAERASINAKQVMFMKKLEGQTHEGIISGVTEWGMYVELKEYTCEGMVRISTIPDDRYAFDPHHFAIKGAKSGKMYRMGDEVKVVVKKANLEKKVVDLEMAN